MTGEKTEFNEWFARMLRRKGLTHMDAAYTLGVHLSTVDKWAAGFRKRPDYEQLVRIVRTFGLPPELARALALSQPAAGTAGHTPSNGGTAPAQEPPATEPPPEGPPSARGGVPHRPGRTGNDAASGR